MFEYYGSENIIQFAIYSLKNLTNCIKCVKNDPPVFSSNLTTVNCIFLYSDECFNNFNHQQLMEY